MNVAITPSVTLEEMDKLIRPPMIIDLANLAENPSFIMPGHVTYIETVDGRARRLKRERRAAYMRKWRAARKASGGQ